MWMPWVLSLLLGRTFNFNDFRAGQDIFPNSELAAKTQTINRYSVDSQCQFVETEAQARNLLNVGAAVSAAFSVKAYGVSLAAAGEYLKDKRDRSKSIEYLCKVIYTTKTLTLRNDARPKTGWKTKWSQKDLGTHYVQSVSYGGELIASFTFQSKTDHDIERVAGSLKAGLTFKGITGSVGGQFEKFQDKANTNTKLNVKYYSTTPIQNLPTELGAFRSVIDSFKDQVKKVNGGLGIPVRVYLASLNRLDVGLPGYLINSATEQRLKQFNEMLGDLVTTDRELHSWAPTLPVLSFTQENKIGQLSLKVSRIIAEFQRAGATLDFTKDSNQLRSAMNLYTSESNGVPYTFARRLRQLKKEFGQ